MAAYGALLSLTHIVEQIQHHPFPPITLDQEQMHSLITKLAFLQDFLENYPHIDEEANGFNDRIADVACAAQEMILWHIQSIHGASTSQREATSSVDLYQALRKVLEDLELIMIDVIKMKENADSSRSARVDSRSTRADHATPPSSLLVGLQDGVAFEILDKLTGELPSNLLIISIVGMGGIGKTTLAQTIYQTPIIVKHFDIRAWISISVEYFNMQDLLLQILACLNCSEAKEGLSDHELGMAIFHSLWSRRYLIVIDDMWSFEAWENVSSFFPDNGNRSRIIITTRLSNVASKFSNSFVHEMKFLDEEKSWDLFCRHAFKDEECHPLDELESIGKIIAQECGGLPLSIVVVGGLLARSPKDKGYWKFIAENLSLAVNLTDNERCLQILHMSYNQLPVYLKPCFSILPFLPKTT